MLPVEKQPFLHNIDLRQVISLANSLQAKFGNTNASTVQNNHDVDGVIKDIAAIESALKNEQVSIKPSSKHTCKTGDVLEQLGVTRESLTKLKNTPEGQKITSDHESVSLLCESVSSLVGRTMIQIKDLEFVPNQSSTELINEFTNSSTIKRKVQPKPDALKEKQTNQKDPQVKESSAFENQSSDEKSEKKEVSSLWKDFIKKQMLPIMPLIYVNGRILDMHEFYEKTRGQDSSCWSEFEFDKRDVEHSMRYLEMMSHDGRSRRDKYTDKDSLLPIISYTGKELKNGIPFIPGFAPYKAEVNGNKLVVERSIFGFYRIKDTSVFDNKEPIRVTYCPHHSVCEDADDIEIKKTIFLLDLLEHTSQDSAPLPAEVHDEIICPGKNVEWRKQLAQMIIALNLGYSKPETFLAFDRHVGPHLSSHLAARRMGTCLHSAITVSDMLNQLDKPHFLTMGRHIDKQDAHVEVWQYLPEYGRTLRIDPTLYASELKKEHEQAMQRIKLPEGTDCPDSDTAFMLGEQIRTKIPSIPHHVGLDCDYYEYLDDRSSRGGMHMMKELSHSSDAMLWCKGEVPLRAALAKSIERFKAGRGDELLKLYFSRKDEINSKIAFRRESENELPKGPADIVLELISAGFRNGEIHPSDLTATYSLGKHYSYRQSLPIGALLLKCTDAELKHLGTSKSAIYSLLRKSPSVINAVFKARCQSYLSEAASQRKYLSKIKEVETLKEVEELLNVLTQGPLSEYDPEHEPKKHPVLRDLCMSLVEIYALSNKLRDPALKETVLQAFRVVGGSFKQIPPIVDLDIFNELKEKLDPDTVEGFFACLRELSSSNKEFSRALSVDSTGLIRLTADGTTRFAKYWQETYDDPQLRGKFSEDFCPSVDYLDFLHQHSITSAEGIRELGKEAKSLLVNDLFHDSYESINPPLDAYPISQLMLLSKRSGQTTYQALLKLREIGVINNDYQSPECLPVEELLSSQISQENESGCDFFGKNLNYGFGYDDKYDQKRCRLKIPLEEIVATVPEFRSKLSPTGLIFLKYHNQLSYQYKDHNESVHNPDEPVTVINYEDAFRLWKQHYPDSFDKFITEIAQLKFPSVFWNRRQTLKDHCTVSQQSASVRLASAVMQLGLMEQYVSGELNKDGIKQVAHEMRKHVYRNLDQPKLDFSNSYLSKNNATNLYLSRINDQIPLVVATGDDSWFNNVTTTVENMDAYRPMLEYDTCANKPYKLSVAEKSLRALLMNESNILNEPINVYVIKALAKQITSELKIRSPLIVSGSQRHGEQIGNRPSFDRTSEFSHFQELAVPEAPRVDWRTYARTDRFYERKTISAENKGETILFNVGKIRSLSSLYNSNGYDGKLNPTIALRTLLRALQSNGHITEHTRFAIYTHGIPVAYFSLKELRNHSVPLLQCFPELKDLNTPLERLIAILILSEHLGEAKSLVPLRKNNSLLEISSDKERFQGQKVVLVTELDSAQEDIAQVQPLIKRGDLSVYKCNNDTGEVSF